MDKETDPVKKATPAQRAKAAVARGAAFKATHGFALVSDSAPPAAAIVAAPPAGVSGLNKFKMNTVVNQATDVELVTLDGKSIAGAYATYRAVFGTVPPPDEELTVEQLTAVKTMIDADMVPYVDFAVWGAHGGRLMRKLKLHGNTFTHDGTLQPIEVSGPPSFDHWLSSYLCLRTALVSWQVVDLGRVDAYARLIGRYVARYEGSWFQIYQADVRCRSEHMERIRRRGEEERAVTELAGHVHALTTAKPWDWVWAEAAKDLEFWRIELEEPALLMLTRARSSAPSGPFAAAGPAKRYALDDAGPAAKAQRFHNVDGNIFKANRRGKRLCEEFNRGNCPSQPNVDTCPKNSGFMHQCSRCLGLSHGLSNCPRSDHPALKAKGSGKSDKGRGKGGKSGKSGGKRWQY